jgi:hypothetical protein
MKVSCQLSRYRRTHRNRPCSANIEIPRLTTQVRSEMILKGEKMSFPKTKRSISLEEEKLIRLVQWEEAKKTKDLSRIASCMESLNKFDMELIKFGRRDLL